MRLATRGSALARWQARHVASLLEARGATTELVFVETTGDQRRDVPIASLGGQGVFVKEVQAAVLDGRADAAVHSAKDLPSTVAQGLVIAAVPPRGDPRDVLVGRRLADLGPGALIATGSVRRRAQLAWLRPDLTFTGLRGNIGTRLDQVPPGGAVVMAAAALQRLELEDRIAEVLDVATMLPQVAQGALAVECRSGSSGSDNGEIRELLASLDEADSHVAVTAERAFLARLGGGCDLPVGAYATRRGDTLDVEGLLASPDGRVVLRHRASGSFDPDAAVALGEAVADYLLRDAGGAELLLDREP